MSAVGKQKARVEYPFIPSTVEGPATHISTALDTNGIWFESFIKKGRHSW